MSPSKFLPAILCAATIAMPLAAARRTQQPAPQQPITLESVIQKVQDQQKHTLTLQADFKQEKELALLAQPEVSSGTFVFSKPNNVLWNYDAPKRVEMLITKGKLTTYYPDLNKAEQIDVKRFEDRIFRYMGASGAIDELGQYFDFTFTDNSASPYWLLDLSPKNRVIARRVRRIKIWIEKSTYLTSKFEYVEGDGDITRYEFTNIKVNQPVEAARFTLDLPPNVKIEQMKTQ